MPDNLRANAEIPVVYANIQGRQTQYRFTRVGNRACLVLGCLAPSEDENDLTTGKGYSHCQSMMLQSCKISAFLPLRVMKADGRMQFYYDITSSATLEKLVSAKGIGYCELSSLLMQISGAVKLCGEYMLDSSCIVFEPEFVFIDPFNFQIKFVLFPFNNESNTAANFRKLAVWIIDHARAAAENTENTDAFIKLQSHLNSESFSIPRFIAEIEKSGLNGAESSRSQQSQSPGLLGFENAFRKSSEKQKQRKMEVFSQAKTSALKNERPKSAYEAAQNMPWYKRKKHTTDNIVPVTETANPFMQEEVYRSDEAAIQNNTESDKTVLLCANKRVEDSEFLFKSDLKADVKADSKTDANAHAKADAKADSEAAGKPALKTVTKPAAYLRNLSGDVTIGLKTGNTGCIIGRKRDLADCIIESKGIGKIHAEISERDGQYYIKDLNSRNGTWVNSVKIEPGEEIKLSHRDVLTFANEDFIIMISR